MRGSQEKPNITNMSNIIVRKIIISENTKNTFGNWMFFHV